ncbi:MAG: 3-ketoacyl-ACP reductase [Flavobacteriaceae bacterium]|nr:3-ketoacyl-ACP reductase [Flavobacteriaceae bacterium]|tara:strand:+ start:3422 stop:4192 length:771 start_codon:yes stop_codon:yes gene_type:complete
MNPVALITGGTRGIGLGIAQSLVQEGYDLVLNGMRPKKQVEAVLASLETKKNKILYCQGNIAAAEDRSRIIQEVKAQFGSLNVLVNNAGIAPKERNDILEATEASYDEVMDINLKGPYFLTQAVANWMIQQKEETTNQRFSIIIISSVSATMSSTNRGEYCLSKAGLAMLTKLWASRMGAFEIPVYEVRPGVIKTDMTSGVEAKYDKLFSEGLALEKRWGTPSDVGSAVAALATGKIPYATGQIINIDGGMTIQNL